MGSLVHFLCIFSILISTGYCLSCIHCRAEGENSCTGEEKKCPTYDDFVCASTSTITIMEGVARKTFTRSCEKRITCGISGNIGYQKGKIKTATSCCYSDSCTPSMPALPPDNTQKAGLTCRSCTSMNSKWCYTDETIDCTGEERRCILQTTSMSGAKSGMTAVRGCATKNLCDIGSRDQDFGDVKMRMEVTCTSVAICLRNNLFVLAFAALLSIKLIS
ncbi:phospholipase A2 inhibitor gamma subunit B-like [Rhinophrynus dorsalis]